MPSKQIERTTKMSNTTIKKTRKPKSKELSKLFAELEKAKEQIAKASGNSDTQIDFELLRSAEKKAAEEIAELMKLPINMISVKADIVYSTAKAAAE